MSNFKKISGQGKIMKYTEAKADDILVENGEFVGITENQFGNLFNFSEVDTGEGKALPACGQLNYMLEQKKLKEGYRYQVIYKGKKTLDSGPYKGKECNDVEVYQDADYVPTGAAASPSQGDGYDDMPY